MQITKIALVPEALVVSVALMLRIVAVACTRELINTASYTPLCVIPSIVRVTALLFCHFTAACAVMPLAVVLLMTAAPVTVRLVHQMPPAVLTWLVLLIVKFPAIVPPMRMLYGAALPVKETGFPLESGPKVKLPDKARVLL